MEHHKQFTGPDNTAVKTALWRALHLQVDATPHIIEDGIGLKLVDPPAGWQDRPDMKFTKRVRASVVARARFIEDLISEESQRGIDQYVILGAGLDSFVQRKPSLASRLRVYEIDEPATQKWKQQRLIQLGFGIPNCLHFVPVNFETSSWLEQLIKQGFNINKPAVVACTGVTLYLTKDAIIEMLGLLSKLATGSRLAINFYLPFELLDEEDKFIHEIGTKKALESGTPFVSYFTPAEILALGNNAGLNNVRLFSTREMEQLYFTNRTDGLLPASGEVFLLATTKIASV